LNINTGERVIIGIITSVPTGTIG